MDDNVIELNTNQPTVSEELHDETAFDDVNLHEDFGDPEQLLNMRRWLQEALEAKGAEFTGGGIGMGEADLDIILEGHEYNINIKPIAKG